MEQRLTFRFCLCLLIVVSALTAGFGQASKVESDILDIMEEHDVVGMSVVVVKDGDIAYSKAFGLKDLESQIPLKENDIFRIASISKSFSATAVMQLVEAKKVSLDDDISDLVGFKVRNPKFPKTVITFKMVLSHTSSINDSQGYFNLDVINPAVNADWEKCYNDYEPGKGYQYCNLNFNMTGAVLERLSGKRFDLYIKERILDPLKLYGGFCVDSLDARRFATLYAYDSISRFTPSPAAYASRAEAMADYKLGYTTPVFSPTGGMKISAPDLGKYMIMHMNRGAYEEVRLISKKSARTMQKTIAKEAGYGLALTNVDNLIADKTMTGHNGNAYGLHSAMFFHPKERFGFVVITNGCNCSYKDGMNEVLRAAIASLYDNLIK